MKRKNFDLMTNETKEFILLNQIERLIKIVNSIENSLFMFFTSVLFVILFVIIVCSIMIFLCQ